jgi:hypothetical protein
LDPIRLFPGRAASIHPPEEKNAQISGGCVFQQWPAQGQGDMGSDEILDFSGGTQPEKEERNST